jgi:acetyl esterase/lipase
MASREYDSFYKALQTKSIPSDLTIEEFRMRFEAWLMEFPAAPEVQIESFKIGELAALWAFAPDVTKRRIILFFHGGAYTAGSIDSHKNFVGRLSAAANAAVLAVQYRRAPEHPFPAALDDALTAYRWLLHHPYARSRIVIGGTSSGGGLALALFLKLKQEQIAMPAGGMCFCPWVDLAMKNETIQKNRGKDLLKPERLVWSAEQYAAGKPLTDPFLSPLYGNLEGLPPLFIQTGTLDLLYGEAVQLAALAEKQGVATTFDVWQDMIHCWQLFAPSFPECQEAIERAGKFVDELFTHKA